MFWRIALMWKYFKIFLRVFLWPVFVLTAYFPRDHTIWVFGSWYGERFADNAKWFYLYCVQSKKNSVKAIWITKSPRIARHLRSEGFLAYKRNSVLGLWYALRAGVYIVDCYIDDINFWASRGAYKVNLWHGIPLKKIERDTENRDNPNYKMFHGNFIQRLYYRKLLPEASLRFNLVTSTSVVVSNFFSSAFGLSLDNIPVTGYPRNDILFRSNCNQPLLEQVVFNKIKTLKQKKKIIIAYMPTFRDSNKSSKLPIDWNRLNNLLESSNSIFLLKLHFDIKTEISKSEELNNVVNLANDFDPYPILNLVDILITDYSSIYLDYLLLDRPIIFYAYDLDNYLKKDRSMYVPFNDVTPGHKVYNFEELLKVLQRTITQYETEGEVWAKERLRVSGIYHKYRDANASQRVYEELCKKIHL